MYNGPPCDITKPSKTLMNNILNDENFEWFVGNFSF